LWFPSPPAAGEPSEEERSRRDRQRKASRLKFTISTVAGEKEVRRFERDQASILHGCFRKSYYFLEIHNFF
jgi:hypothetical protein